MKKVFLIFCCLLATMLASGSFSYAQKTETVSFAGKSAGTASYAIHVPVMNTITKYSGIKVTYEPIGGIGAFGPVMERHEVELGVDTAYVVWAFFKGTGSYAKAGRNPWMRLWVGTGVGSYAYHVRADSKIYKIEDFAGKKCMVEMVGVASLGAISDIIFKKYGISDKVTVLPYGSTDDAARAMIEGSVDVLHLAVCPSSAQIDVSPCGLRLIPLSQADVDVVNDRLGSPVFTLMTLPANFMGMKAKTDLPFIAEPMLYVCHKDVSEDAIYRMTKAIYDHHDEYKNVVPFWHSMFTLKNALRTPVIPFHNGAIKYFKEVGVWSSEMDKIQKKLLEEAR